MLDSNTVSAIRRVRLVYFWAAAAAATGYLVASATVLETVRTALGGMPDPDDWIEMYFVGSLTLPLTLSIATIVYMLINVPPMESSAATFGLFGAILVGAGLLSTYLVSFAIPVEFTPLPGHPYYSWLLVAVQAYASAYGWSFFISAIVIGSAIGLSVDRAVSRVQ